MTEKSGTCAFVNSQCTQRGTVWINELGQCKAVVGPGARVCSHRQQCREAFPNAECVLQQCTCPSNRPVPVDGTCGIQCAAGESFSGVLGLCIASKIHHIYSWNRQAEWQTECMYVYEPISAPRGTWYLQKRDAPLMKDQNVRKGDNRKRNQWFTPIDSPMFWGSVQRVESHFLLSRHSALTADAAILASQ